MPEIRIPNNVIADSSLNNVIKDSEIIVLAVPSEFFRMTVKSIKPFYDGQTILSVTKGIEYHTCKRMSQIIEDELTKKNIAVLSGPNHSEEVIIKMPTASVVASKDKKIAKNIAEILAMPYFKTYQLSDVAGVEICGALKNICAIAMGICDESRLGDNARGSLLTLGLMEVNSFGRYFGAERATVYGLAGVGDLIATCFSSHSRNRFVGQQLAKMKLLDEIKKEMHGMVAEGVATTRAVHEFSIKHNINMPLTSQVYEVLFNKKNVKKAIEDLLELV